MEAINKPEVTPGSPRLVMDCPHRKGQDVCPQCWRGVPDVCGMPVKREIHLGDILPPVAATSTPVPEDVTTPVVEPKVHWKTKQALNKASKS